MKEIPDNWQERLPPLETIDWSKKTGTWIRSASWRIQSFRTARPQRNRSLPEIKLGLKLTDGTIRSQTVKAIPNADLDAA